MSSLSPEARKLLESSRHAGGPTSAQRAAMKSAVLGAVLVPGAAAGSTAAAVSGAKATGLGLAAKLGLALVVVGLGAAVTWQLVAPVPVEAVAHVALADSLPPVPPEVIAAVEPLEVVEPQPTAVEEPRPSPLQPPRAVVPRLAAPRAEVVTADPDQPPVTPPAAVEDPTLARELAALSGAMGAVDSRQFAVALEQLSTYRAAFPSGALGTEAGVLEVMALCGLGKVEEARTAAHSLPSNNPAVRRLERSCISGR